MENTPAFHPLDYVSVVRRRVWWLVVPLALAAAIGAALVMYLPREYTTSASLGVSAPQVSPELVNSSNSQRVTPEDRIAAIVQGIKNPALIERVVREEGLDKNMPTPDAIAMVRGRISVPTPDINAAGTAMQFSIGYRDSSPDKTQRIANRLADVFVSESTRRKEVRAEETTAFIGRQLQASQERMNDLESRMRSAKETYMGALPEQTQANVAMVTGAQQQLETTSNAIRGEQDRLSVIERQIESMKAGAVQEVAIPGVPSTSASPAVVRVVQLERELAVARGNYTDKHPEVIRLQGELASAKADAAAEASRPAEERQTTLKVDPAYRALLADQEQARLRIRDLQRNEDQVRSQIGMYRARVESAPRVEQQMATLQREYDLEKEGYTQLTAKMRNAEMAESLERSSGGEQFAVLARAPLPTEPTSPNTQRLMMVAILLGLVAGAGLALGREYLNRSIHDARALTDLDLPVLGEIPRIAHA